MKEKDKTSSSDLVNSYASADVSLAHWQLYKRGVDKERQDYGSTKKVDFLRRYIKEECDDIEYRDWWGNGEV